MKSILLTTICLFLFSIPAFSAVSFQKDIQPILNNSCIGCHNPANPSGGLDLTTFAAALKGGKQPLFINMDTPEKSILIEYVIGDEPLMPLSGDPLNNEEVNLLLQWIKEGAQNDTTAPTQDKDGVMIYHTPPVITALSYSPSGETVAVSGSGEILLNHADGSGLIARMPGRAERLTSIEYSPDGSIIAAVGGSPWQFGEIQFWSVKHNMMLRSVKKTFDTLQGASFSPDGTMLAFGGSDKKAYIVTVPFGKELIQFENHDNWVMDTLFTTNGVHVVSTGLDKALKLFVAETGSFVDDINSSNKGIEAIMSIDRHPTKDQLVMGGEDGIPRIYKIYRTQKRDRPNTDFNLIKTFEKIVGGINIVRFSPDGTKIAAGANKGRVRIYDVDSGDYEILLYGDAVTVFAMEFHPTKPEIAVGGLEGKVRVYHTQTGELLHEFYPVEIETQEISQTP